MLGTFCMQRDHWCMKSFRQGLVHVKRATFRICLNGLSADEVAENLHWQKMNSPPLVRHGFLPSSGHLTGLFCSLITKKVEHVTQMKDIPPSFRMPSLLLDRVLPPTSTKLTTMGCQHVFCAHTYVIKASIHGLQRSSTLQGVAYSNATSTVH